MDVGVAYLSEDRKATGLVLPMSVTANVTLATLRKYGRLLRKRREARAARRRVAELGIRVRSIRQPVSGLSGGNQQKVALAKWLEAAPEVLILDEPTRGVDVGAKEQIYQQVRRLTAAGMACILISSELNEVLALSHRVAVMRAGRLVGTLDAATRHRAVRSCGWRPASPPNRRHDRCRADDCRAATGPSGAGRFACRRGSGRSSSRPCWWPSPDISGRRSCGRPT